MAEPLPGIFSHSQELFSFVSLMTVCSLCILLACVYLLSLGPRKWLWKPLDEGNASVVYQKLLGTLIGSREIWSWKSKSFLQFILALKVFGEQETDSSLASHAPSHAVWSLSHCDTICPKAFLGPSRCHHNFRNLQNWNCIKSNSTMHSQWASCIVYCDTLFISIS